MQKVRLPFGKKFMNLEVDTAHVLGVLLPKSQLPRKPFTELLTESLSNPVASKPFREIFHRNEKTVIVLPDKTRYCAASDVLPIVVAELYQLGISDTDIKILIATGSHISQKPQEIIDIVGMAMTKRLTIIDHDSQRSEDLVFKGRTKFGIPVYLNRHLVEADRIIILCSAVHHYFAGYGGGWKMINPGCAGYETITRNHALTVDTGSNGLHPNCGSGIIDGNPVQEDLLDSMRYQRVDFLIETLLNEDGEVVDMVAGDVFAAHRKACMWVDQTYRVAIQEKADLVVVSCGGFPKDINLIQSHKSLHNAFQAVRQGGVILLLAECRDGVGSQTFMDWFRHEDEANFVKNMKNHYSLNATTALSLKTKTKQVKVILVSTLPSGLVSHLGMHPAEDIRAGWRLACADLPDSFKCYILPNGSLTLPVVI
ncbi:MAG: nickel-dependent lactate racemase [bacterium]